ncbi:M10 family metallopeptidase C-terminal domain-containing protein, partial [Rhizobium sp. IY2]|uniref:M10 family metallopeptidase C-terminal domain-containing protein n=1 Tax=Rhizobium sp. IY2 TaxID=3397853 RepID=UPI0039E011EE
MTNLITSTKNVSLTGDQKVDGLFSGTAWDGTITYAFPTFSTSYSYAGEKDWGFSAISSQQQSFALFFMEQSYGNTANDGFSVEGFTNANFQAGSAETASVRFAQSWMPPTAWAYYPDTPEAGGDVWFGTSYAGTEVDLRFPEFGNYAGHTLVHELGHALGLKHAHEPIYFDNSTVVPSAYDSLEYTVMTYRTFVGDDTTSGYKYEHDGAPQSFMMLDIAALQEMYGADYTTNSGNTVYKWNPNQGITYVNGVAAITPDANRIFATIWDGGGIDTYDLSAYTTNLTIDLRAGGYSVFSQGQLADLGGGPNNGYARGNIFNALLYHNNVASLIENVQAGSGDDTIVGNEANNTLWGNAGNDSLSGGTGVDTLIGGTGNDTYFVDNAADVVTENASEGTDTVRATASYTLGANVENLTFIGTGAFSGIGNGLANTITGGASTDTLLGGAGNDTLDGGAGADTLLGGAGDDTYIVDNAGDSLTENASEGTDTVRTNLASYTLGANIENLTYNGTAAFAGTGNSLDNLIIGGAASDTLSGGAGNDTLNGSAGADTLIGGAGDDIYAVDNAGDSVAENASEGTDTVRTNLASYTLGANVENLTYNGTAAFAGTGNSLDNLIIGGAASDTLSGGDGNDTLNGSAGADTLIGGAGDDIYAVDNAGDSVTESASEGTDTVRTNLASYTLGANIENLTYNGTAAFTGTGNASANTIRGAAGADILDGKAGADTLIGGAGNDTYIVDDIADVVTEGSNEGTDLIRTVLSSYALTNIANVENLTFIGTGDFIGTGNSLANTITGGAGNDTLDGGTGADLLIGGAGNDLYVVDSASDVIDEAASAGTDEIRTALSSYTLGTNVETLTYTGSASFTGIGNALANTITGGAGNDTLNGSAGADTLIGGAG